MLDAWVTMSGEDLETSLQCTGFESEEAPLHGLKGHAMRERKGPLAGSAWKLERTDASWVKAPSESLIPACALAQHGMLAVMIFAMS